MRPLRMYAGASIRSSSRCTPGRIACGALRRRRVSCSGLLRAHEVEQMGAFGVIELQRARQRLEDAVGDAGGVAAFELGVVGDADTGERGDLLAAQAGNTTWTAAEGADARLRGRDPAAPRGEELLDLQLCVHVVKVTPLARLMRGTAGTPIAGSVRSAVPMRSWAHGIRLSPSRFFF